MTLEEMIAKAHEGYFVRDAERNMVICPQGEILRPKSVKKNGNIRYCNKLACKRCKAKCTTAKFKEADFSKDCLLKKVGRKRRLYASNFRWMKRRWTIGSACQNILLEPSNGR